MIMITMKLGYKSTQQQTYNKIFLKYIFSNFEWIYLHWSNKLRNVGAFGFTATSTAEPKKG